jgi:hypothetical protein
MNTQPSPDDIARYQAIYERRRTRRLGAFTVLVYIVVLGGIASLTGFGHIRVFVAVGITGWMLYGFWVGLYWRCPRCQTSFGGGSPDPCCKACGLVLAPRASTEPSNDR